MASFSPVHMIRKDAGNGGKKNGSNALLFSMKSSLLPLLIAGDKNISKISILFNKEGKA